MPILKRFLKDGEAESYRNVQVTFVSGRKAVMTIYEGETEHDWEEKEKIVLSDYKTQEEMHALMVEKGFQLKSEEEIEAMKLAKQKAADEEQEQKMKRAAERRSKYEQRNVEEKGTTPKDEKKEMNTKEKMTLEEQRQQRGDLLTNEKEL